MDTLNAFILLSKGSDQYNTVTSGRFGWRMHVCFVCVTSKRERGKRGNEYGMGVGLGGICSRINKRTNDLQSWEDLLVLKRFEDLDSY